MNDLDVLLNNASIITMTILSALVFPYPGKFLFDLKLLNVRVVNTVASMIIMLFSGLSLDISDAIQIFTHKKILFLGCIVSMCMITPLFGFLFINIPLQEYYQYGLALSASTPSSLFALPLVIAAKGDTALAVIIVFAGNFVSVVSVPLWLKIFCTTVTINIPRLLMLLSIGTIAPFCLGVGIQCLLKSRKCMISRVSKYVNMFFLNFMVWNIVGYFAVDILQQRFIDVLMLAGITGLQHVFYLTMHFLSLLKHPDRDTIVYMASQKSITYASIVIMFMDESPGMASVLTPCLVNFFVQFCIDVSWWFIFNSKKKDIVMEP